MARHGYAHRPHAVLGPRPRRLPLPLVHFASRPPPWVLRRGARARHVVGTAAAPRRPRRRGEVFGQPREPPRRAGRCILSQAPVARAPRRAPTKCGHRRGRCSPRWVGGRCQPRRRPGQLYVRSTIRAGIDQSTTRWLSAVVLSQYNHFPVSGRPLYFKERVRAPQPRSCAHTGCEPRGGLRVPAYRHTIF
jgi:hypothetical protein